MYAKFFVPLQSDMYICEYAHVKQGLKLLYYDTGSIRKRKSLF